MADQSATRGLPDVVGDDSWNANLTLEDAGFDKELHVPAGPVLWCMLREFVQVLWVANKFCCSARTLVSDSGEDHSWLLADLSSTAHHDGESVVGCRLG